MGLPRFLVVSTATLWLVGCFGTEKTLFPPGLDPLEEENSAEFPVGSAEDPYPETLDLVSGIGYGYHFGHARGYVHAPIQAVRAALLEPEVVVNRRKVDRWRVTDFVEPDYEQSYQIRGEVDDLISIWYHLTFRFGTGEDGAFLARWQKTDGTTVIKINEGSVIAREVEEDVTSLEIIQHLEALRDSEENIRSYLPDLFASVVAHAHGQALPTY